VRIDLRISAAIGLAVTALLLGNVPAAAQTAVSSRAALGGNDFLDWSALGPAGTVVSNPFTVASNGGISVTGTETGGTMRRLDQHTPLVTSGQDFQGNFARGDALLFTNTPFGGGTGPIDLTFGVAVSGAGAQVMRDEFGAFVGTITAFDSANNVILSSNFNGLANSNEDNSAIFMGITSSVANIKRIRFAVDTNHLVINRLDIVTAPTSVTPEPAALALALPGLMPFGVLALRRRRRSA
jgi:hypothetical protein